MSIDKDKLLGIVCFDADVNSHEHSEVSSVEAMSRDDVDAAVQLNEERLNIMGVEKPNCQCDSCGYAQRSSWSIRWKRDATRSMGFEITGMQNAEGRVYVYVDGLLLTAPSCDKEFSIKVNKIKRLKSGQSIILANGNGVLPYEGKGICWSAPRYKKGRTARDFYAEIIQGKFLSKKNRLVFPFFMREEHKQRYFYGYHFINSIFRQIFDKELLLTHGTLLGIVRDGDLIESDDDFDCVYISKMNRIEDVCDELYKIGSRFQRLGFVVKYSRTGHLKLKIGDCEFDVMPAWHEAGLFHVSSYTSIPMDPADTAPTGRLDYRGTAVSCFSNPEKFLELNYGASWRHPDPDYVSTPNPKALENKRIFQKRWRAL